MAATAATAVAKKVVLVTGATSGIGLELCHQLLASTSPTYHIFLGFRSVQKGLAILFTTKALYPNTPGIIEILQLDVTSDVELEAAVQNLKKRFGKLDVLVNNAGVAVPEGSLREQMRLCFDVNATGPAVIGEAFGPLLKAAVSSSPTPTDLPPRIINISSGVGSMTRRLDSSSPMYNLIHHQYRTSKAALNMVTINQYVEFGPEVKVFAYDPGFTVSNLGPQNTKEGGAREAKESVEGLVRVVKGERDGEVGGFLHRDGGWGW